MIEFMSGDDEQNGAAILRLSTGTGCWSSPVLITTVGETNYSMVIMIIGITASVWMSNNQNKNVPVFIVYATVRDRRHQRDHCREMERVYVAEMALKSSVIK